MKLRPAMASVLLAVAAITAIPGHAESTCGAPCALVGTVTGAGFEPQPGQFDNATWQVTGEFVEGETAARYGATLSLSNITWAQNVAPGTCGGPSCKRTEVAGVGSADVSICPDRCDGTGHEFDMLVEMTLTQAGLELIPGAPIATNHRWTGAITIQLVNGQSEGTVALARDDG